MFCLKYETDSRNSSCHKCYTSIQISLYRHYHRRLCPNMLVRDWEWIIAIGNISDTLIQTADLRKSRFDIAFRENSFFRGVFTDLSWCACSLGSLVAAINTIEMHIYLVHDVCSTFHPLSIPYLTCISMQYVPNLIPPLQSWTIIDLGDCLAHRTPQLVHGEVSGMAYRQLWVIPYRWGLYWRYDWNKRLKSGLVEI